MVSRRECLCGGLALAAAAFGRVPARAETPDPLARIETSGKIIQRFGRASGASIDAYEKTYGTRFSDAYRAFLQRENGLVFNFDFDEAKKAGVSPALADMNTFFGIGSADPDTDLILLTPNMRFWNSRFVPFAPVIGLGGDFCTYAEINGGKYSGQIMYTDGELYSHYKTAPLDGPVDDLIDGFVKDGWFRPVATSFEALLADYAKMA